MSLEFGGFSVFDSSPSGAKEGNAYIKSWPSPNDLVREIFITW